MILDISLASGTNSQATSTNPATPNQYFQRSVHWRLWSVERVDNPPWAGSLHSELLSKLVKHLERLCTNVRVRAVRRNPQLTGSSNWITFTP